MTASVLAAILAQRPAAAVIPPAAAPAPAPGEAPAAPPADEKAPPLPFHTIEGVGGGAITPMAYLVNPGKPECFWGKPAVSMSYVNAGRKSLESVGVSETIFGRVELSYAPERLGLGSLPGDIQNATHVDIGTNDVWLHNFNIRYLLVKENSLDDLPIPAITTGIHLKYNGQIADIDNRLGHALTNIGYRGPGGIEYTLTATKTFAKAFGRPLIATAGLRVSSAADLGFLGFTDSYHASFEGNVAYLVSDRILLAYEFRQKSSPLGTINGLIGDEDNWHAIDVALIMSKHATFVAGWASLGTLANTDENGAWFLQLKYEF